MKALSLVVVALLFVCGSALPPVKEYTYRWTQFQGKTVFITGGTSGMGLATAEAFAAAGARVVICTRDSHPHWYAGENVSFTRSVDPNVASLGGYVRLQRCDVSNKTMLMNALLSTAKHDGVPDIYVNAAGMVGTVGDMDDIEDFLMTGTDAFYTNGVGVLLSMALEIKMITEQHTKALKEGIREEPEKYKIINIGSLDGYHATGPAPLYATSKHAVWMTTKCASEENVGLIRVNGLAPGFVNTSLVWQQVKLFENPPSQTYDDPYITPDQEIFKKYLPQFTGYQPSGRFTQPEEVAKFIMWLASDEAQGINGRVFAIDGGHATI